MKTPFSIIVFSLLLPVKALADNHNLSVGYQLSNITNDTHGRRSNDDRLDGFNIKYRYEWGEPLGPIGSLSYMTANASSSWAVANKVQNDLRYSYSGFSLTAGPVWRFNDYVSVYGVIGINYDDYSSHFRKSTFKTGDAPATNYSRSELKKPHSPMAQAYKSTR
ncbi:Outer membrane protein X precursor [Sodalis glossinidius str. 'morsitans']|uniref:Outer membrane protein X n=1 Tax=Sodalis glossinidius (strain morsitans) TaxID=343509 RepID=A0A193QF81_SODGM|nr:Ail/Lom family outer membrane beta-barrel protein [Sodalis glossinidius]CRL43824.1 Outer membrane protein X precursor [Sodalis glossinidius str. 'morsitans']